jgi:hypothetical protein
VGGSKLVHEFSRPHFPTYPAWYYHSTPVYDICCQALRGLLARREEMGPGRHHDLLDNSAWVRVRAKLQQTYR